MASPLVYHRGPDFPDLLKGLVRDLKFVFPTTDEVFILSCSGSGAMEAGIVNCLSKGDRVLVVSAGQFGQKWVDVCKAYGLSTEVLEFPWGESADPLRLREALKKDPDIRAVLATQSETSTGVLHNIEAMGEMVREADALFLVDGVSSVVAHALPTADWGVDIAVTASQKGLMVPPGLAVITMSARAREAASKSDLPRAYLDLDKYRTSYSEGRGPATLPVTLMKGLRAALDMIIEQGMESIWRRHTIQAESVRSAANALGLSCFAKSPSSAVTSIALPDEIDGLILMETLRTKYGVVVGGGLGPLRGRMIRISNLGYIDHLDVLTAISALEMGLRHLGWAFDPGAGVAAAEVVLVGGEF
jgi:aspartate aminotransferase-like enzyme